MSPVVEILSKVEGVIDEIEGMTRVRACGIDGGKSVVSGGGLEKCVLGGGVEALSNNVIAVSCVDDGGEAVSDVTADDVDVIIRGVGVGGDGGEGKAAGGAGGEGAGVAGTDAVGVVVKRSVKDGSVGVVEFVYAVNDEYEGDEVTIDVVLRGSRGGQQHVTGSPFRVACQPKVPPVTCRAAGKHVKTIAVINSSKYGMAVSPDEKWLVVADCSKQAVVVYELSSGAVVRTIGGPGNGPCQFNSPYRLCFAPNSNILVCDRGNGRVQELTTEGAHVRSIAVSSQYPCSICCDGSVIVVGRNSSAGRCQVEVYDYKSGTLLRSFAPYGSAAGQVHYAWGVRLTPDGKHVLVAEHGNQRLSLFTLEGAFVKHIGAGIVATGEKDVDFAANGEIIVADYRNHRICVFSADGSTLVHSWGIHGTDDGQFNYPTALAVHGSRLYALDCGSPRVQVFE